MFLSSFNLRLVGPRSEGRINQPGMNYTQPPREGVIQGWMYNRLLIPSSRLIDIRSKVRWLFPDAIAYSPTFLPFFPLHEQEGMIIATDHTNHLLPIQDGLDLADQG